MIRVLLHSLVTGLVLTMTGNSCAQEDELHRITGFRSAQFGMNADEVRTAIRRDFQVDDAAIQEIENIDEATLVLTITVPQLEPGPGPAEIYYILGASSQRLMHINVVWSTSETPSDEERNHIGIAGMQLARYFSARQWKPDGTLTGLVSNPGEVVVFVGVDPNDSGVEVLVRGIPVTGPGGNTRTPDGQALLRLSYMQRVGRPDVIEVQEGNF